MTPAQWRSAAVAALWALVVATFALTAFSLWQAESVDAFSIFGALRLFLAALVLVWWTQVFTRYTAGQGARELEGVVVDGPLLALRAVFPWLTAIRLTLWAVQFLALAVGAAPEVNTVAVAALITIELGFILAKNAVYGTLARFASSPQEMLGRARLMQWLNVAAALALGIGVINVVPIAGLSGERDLLSQVVYGLHAALDVLASVLALKAVQAMPSVERP